jgi:putative oxidoreductase
MKVAVMIARVLVGLIFLVFGLNGFLHFIPQPPMPPSDGTTFLEILLRSHYVLPVCAFQVIGGLLLLIGRFVPLGITLLGPIVVNILLTHIFLEPMGIALAAVIAVLWLFLLWAYRQYFASLFTANAIPG